MTATEKSILRMLKDGKSQNSIANELGVPRSMVQRVSDQELGVDPASLKSLTTEQIELIQSQSQAGESNTTLASAYGVSPKTIARALMVRIIKQANNITVISPIKESDATKEFEVLEGGVAVYEKDDEEWYVGKFMENHGQFLCLRYTDDSSCAGIKAAMIPRDQLKPSESSDKFNSKNDGDKIVALAEVASALVDGYKGETSEITVILPDEDTYPMRGSMDARRRVGYYDSILGRTLRLALSSVTFKVKLKETQQIGDKQTKAEFGDKELSVFLNEHQIMILPESVVIVIDGKPETITTSHQSYDRIVEAIKSRDIKLAYTLMKPREAIKKFATGLVDISNNRVRWSGHDITGTSVAKRILTLMLRGDYSNMQRLTNFLDKMFQNPSSSLVQSGRIYEFMAYSDIEIAEDGDIILYKSVRGNYMDKHSGTIDNTPGTIVRMARSFVNDDNKDLCSYGLHVCSLAYLKQCFGYLGQRVVRCKLNPKDIVSITDDYKSSKIRCCEYLVLDDYTTEYNRQHKSIDVEGLYR